MIIKNIYLKSAIPTTLPRIYLFMFFFPYLPSAILTPLFCLISLACRPRPPWRNEIHAFFFCELPAKPARSLGVLPSSQQYGAAPGDFTSACEAGVLFVLLNYFIIYFILLILLVFETRCPDVGMVPN